MDAMTTAAIRLARSDNNSDAQNIAVMSRCLIELGLRGWSWDPARVTRAIRNRSTCVVVAEIIQPTLPDPHCCAGFAGFAIAEFGDTRLHLSLLAVSATHQRHGIGRALVAWLEKSALTAGITEVQLELRANNASAKFFYQALGYEFVQAVPGYYSGIETAFKMRKAIGAVTPARTRT